MNIFSILARSPYTVLYRASPECFPGLAVAFVGPGYHWAGYGCWRW